MNRPRYPFYELATRRLESDGAERRCYQGADESTRVLFVWYAAAGDSERSRLPIQAQLLLGDETYVEWRARSTVAGITDRAMRNDTESRGVRSLHATGDRGLFDRAREMLLGSDLPSPLVADLLASLPEH